MKSPRWLIPASNLLSSVLFAIAEWIEDRARHLKRCKACGRSTYYGAPCIPPSRDYYADDHR